MIIPHLSHMKKYKWPSGHEKIYSIVVSRLKEKMDKQGYSENYISVVKWVRQNFFLESVSDLNLTGRLKLSKDYVDAAWAHHLHRMCLLTGEDFEEK